jgi:hypothetical protein
MKKKYNLDYFLQKSWSLVLLKNGKIVYKSKLQGLKPLIFCIKKYEKEMRATIVFDKVIGQAAAFLLAYSNISEVWTPTISKDAEKILKKNKIKVSFDKKVKCIMNQKGDDLCPMEKLSQKEGAKIIGILLGNKGSG